MLTTVDKIWRKILIGCFKLFNRDYLSRQKIHPLLKVEKIGSDYGGWYVPKSLLTEESIIYCAGCGEDISFDLGLIQEFGCRVWGFDPTPRAIDYVVAATENEPNYTFRPIGIWDRKDTLEFFAPANSEHVSHSLLNLQKTDQPIVVEVDSIANIMRDLGHNSIDLLKLDIEGAEYKAIASLLTDGILPKIICVEYDEFFNPLDLRYRARIRESVENLIANGYSLVNSEFNGNYTFVSEQT